MKIKITIPDSLKEIPLWRYQQFEKMKGDEQDDELIARLLVSNFCNIPFDLIDKLDVNTYNLAVQTIANALTEKPSLTKRFKFQGVEYGFIPKLDKMTMAEFVDCDTYITDIEQWHRLMAIFYRPIKKKIGIFYEIEEYEGSDKYCEIMKQVPVHYAMGAMVFFWNLGNKLATHMILSLEETLTEEQHIRLKQILETNGDGINPFTLLHKAMSSSLMK